MHRQPPALTDLDDDVPLRDTAHVETRVLLHETPLSASLFGTVGWLPGSLR